MTVKTEIVEIFIRIVQFAVRGGVVLAFRVSRNFRTHREPPAADAAKAADLVFSARARASREKRTRRTLGILGALLAPLLALKIHGSSGPAHPAGAPAEIPVASLSAPKALPHLVTQRAPQSRNRDGVDFIATATAAPPAMEGARRARSPQPKPAVKKKKAEPPR